MSPSARLVTAHLLGLIGPRLFVWSGAITLLLTLARLPDLVDRAAIDHRLGVEWAVGGGLTALGYVLHKVGLWLGRDAEPDA